MWSREERSLVDENFQISSFWFLCNKFKFAEIWDIQLPHHDKMIWYFGVAGRRRFVFIAFSLLKNFFEELWIILIN